MKANATLARFPDWIFRPPMLRSALFTIILSLGLPSGSRAADAAALWSGQIQPLLDLHCIKCHGPLEQKGGLELDTPAAVLKGGDEGAVLTPGKPEESPLYKNLSPEADPHMPPKKQLSDPERAAIREWIMALATAPGTSASAPAAPVPSTPRSFDSVTQAIDTLIAEGWQQRGLSPAWEVADATWARRLYLDLAGRIPAEPELAAFLAAPAETRRASLVDNILASPDYPVRMRELWDSILLGRGRRGGQEDPRKQNGWWTFLEHAFRSNRPWPETVRDIISARPDKPENSGASWFLYEQKDRHQKIAEAVAPIVYGTRIDCAQCHDHPLAREIKQGHYWGLVAAFNRSKNVEGTRSTGESAVGGFINFTNLKKESQPATVTLLTGHTIPETWPAGDQKETDSDDKYEDPAAKVRVPVFSRRAAFASAATQENPLLARAFVNRTWAMLLGRGLVHPMDEMTTRNVPSHPALLDWLAADFTSHHFDIRRLIGGIVLSHVYALAPASQGTSPAAPDAFASAPERPLAAEQIARSWRIAAGLPPSDDSLRRAVIAALPDVMPREYSTSFQQAQFLTSSMGLTEILQPQTDNTTTRIATLPDPASRVRAAFQSVYQRLPDMEEASAAEAFLASREAKSTAGIRDLLWALLTSAEFLTTP